LGNDLDTVLNFCNQIILNTLPRDDYKEFIELIIIFLEGVPIGGFKFKSLERIVRIWQDGWLK